MKLTQEEIKKQLQAIQHDSFNEKDIERYTSLIFQDKKGNERNEKDKNIFLKIIYDENIRESVKDYPYVNITKDKTGRYFINIKRNTKIYPVMKKYIGGEHKDEIKKTVYKQAEDFNQILTQGYTECEIEFPTGHIIFTNFFKNNQCNGRSFDVPENLKYKNENCINHLLGEQNTMKILSSTHGLGYVQLGNTSTTIYKVNDNTIIMTSPLLDYYDDETDKEYELSIPDEWEELGEIICDVWRVEFIDELNFHREDPLPIDDPKYNYNKPFKGKVNPGKWRVINYYRFINDENIMKNGHIPIWVELKRF
jgi:hypothetical protein